MGDMSPPFGVVGRGIDEVLLHRVAEATAKDFVEAVAGAVQSMIAAETPEPSSPDIR